MADNNSGNNLFSNETATAWAEVILPLAIPKTYTYTIPQHLQSKAQPGCRAEVVFGKNKKYAGIVKSVSNKKPGYETKEILNIIDEEPIIYPQQLQLWHWISEYYMCSEGEVMTAALPTHLKLSSETVIVFNEEYGEDFSDLDNEEFLVAEALLIKKELRLPEIQQILDINHVYPLIKKLIEKKVCYVWEAFSEKYKQKKENFVILNPEYNNEEKLNDLLNNWGKAPKQMELLLSYLHISKTEGDVTQTALLKKSGASAAQLKGLVEKNILFIEKRNIDRVENLPQKIYIDFELSPVQTIALNEINSVFAKKNEIGRASCRERV